MRTIARVVMATLALVAGHPSSAASLSVGSIVAMRVTASSTGAPCEANCWEQWVDQGGRGTIIVQKNYQGEIAGAGTKQSPYFLDLYSSIDEASRKIPSAQQLIRYGTVGNAFSNVGNNTCAATCGVILNFGYNQFMTVALDADGKINWLQASSTGMIRPMDEPGGNADNVGNPNIPNCPSGGANCEQRLGGPSVAGINPNGTSLLMYYTWVQYASDGSPLSFTYYWTQQTLTSGLPPGLSPNPTIIPVIGPPLNFAPFIIDPP